jgi:uncharacterized DUF497 family protein
VGITFDPKKDVINKNHGISLSRATDFDLRRPSSLWMIAKIMARFAFVLGFLEARVYALVFAQDKRTFAPSALRKATKHEEKEYEQNR